MSTAPVAGPDWTVPQGLARVLSARAGALALAGFVGWMVPFTAICVFIAVSLSDAPLESVEALLTLSALFLLPTLPHVWVTRITLSALGVRSVRGPKGWLKAIWTSALVQVATFLAALVFAVAAIVLAVLADLAAGRESPLSHDPEVIGVFIGGGLGAALAIHLWSAATAAACGGAGVFAAFAQSMAVGRGRRLQVLALAIVQVAVWAIAFFSLLANRASDATAELALLIVPASAVLIVAGSMLWAVLSVRASGAPSSVHAGEVADVFS